MNNKNKVSKVITYTILSIFFIAVFLICCNVFPYGDDFFYGTFTKEGFARYIERHVEHYQLANGRVIVHLLATFFLGQNLWLWRIINALSFAACALLIVKLARPSPKYQPLCAALVCTVFLIINTKITRQSLYWLTGSLNYLYPMLILLLYWFLFSRALQKNSRMIWLPFFSFLAAATTEQGGLMCFGLTLLLLLDEKFIQKKRIRPAHIIALVTAGIGILTVLMAPGVSNRVGMTDSPISGGLLSLILYNLKHQGKILFLSDYTWMFHIILLFFAVFLLGTYAAKSQKSNLRTFHASGAILGTISFIFYVITLSLRNELSMIWTVCAIGGYLVTLLWCAISSLRYQKDSTLCIALILAFGSQLAMVVSPVAGPRTLISFIFMAALFLAKVCGQVARYGAINIFSTLFCTVTGQPYFTIVTIPSFYFGVFGKSARLLFLYIGMIPMLLSALFCWNDTYMHTTQNAKIYRENIAVIESYPGTGTLTQKKLPCECYAWVMPYHNKYYDPYYNIFFDLPSNTTIHWITP